jgi:hypothetical protein
VTPAHWHVGRDHVTLTDPAALELDETDSRVAFEAVRELFESEGFRFEWGAATRWYAAHESLVELPCASLDRATGRNVERWLHNRSTPSPHAKLIRRLQSEVQLLLYPHPLNEAREQRDALTLNSFWLSGCGRLQPDDADAVRTDDRLRTPLFADDWAAWADAWRALDAGPIVEALSALQNGQPVALTLCGERGAHRFETVTQSLWQRIGRYWQTREPHELLEAL